MNEREILKRSNIKPDISYVFNIVGYLCWGFVFLVLMFNIDEKMISYEVLNSLLIALSVYMIMTSGYNLFKNKFNELDISHKKLKLSETQQSSNQRLKLNEEKKDESKRKR